MSNIITLSDISDQRGSLTVIEKIIPFEIKRVFYIYNVAPSFSRGGHGHIRTHMALTCVHGSCTVLVKNEQYIQEYNLNSPLSLLYLEPKDWHIMNNFSKDAVLLVLASEYYDKDDYILEPPQ